MYPQANAQGMCCWASLCAVSHGAWEGKFMTQPASAWLGPMPSANIRTTMVLGSARQCRQSHQSLSWELLQAASQLGWLGLLGLQGNLILYKVSYSINAMALAHNLYQIWHPITAHQV